MHHRGLLAALACVLAGLAGISGILLLDIFHWKRDLLGELPPDLRRGHIIRSGLIFASVLALLLPVLWNVLSVKMEESGSGVFERGCMTGSVVIAAGFLWMFMSNIPLFCALALEDSLVEWGSFALWMAGFGMLAATLVSRRRSVVAMESPRWLLGCAALGFFVIGMEEVSWLQRVFQVETPELFASNAQGEMNFHNLGTPGRGTDYVENAYYMAAFVFLVLLPCVRAALPGPFESPWLRSFAPRAFVAVPGVLACAYTYDMWNIVFIQLQFFASVIVLAAFAWRSSQAADRGILFSALVLMLVTQGVFLMNGHRLMRDWDTTEYREFLIPLGFLMHAIDVHRRHRSETRGYAGRGLSADRSCGVAG